MEKKYTLEDLRAVIARLRGENGCPWDRVQTHESLRADMLEEAYEAVDAIEKNDMENLKEELEDVIGGICEKMVYRHPHVFGELSVDTAEQVLVNWEKLKKKEKHMECQTDVLKSVPDALPALTRARKVQKKAADVGFDFYAAGGALEKVKEEICELEEAIAGKNDNIEEEFGDILFAMVNVARFLQINPEFALTKATKKFINRFEYIENSALSEGKQLSNMTLEEMDLLWDKAKKELSEKV